MNKNVILQGIDIIKGATLSKNYNNSMIYDAMPWQMVNLEDKTQEWKHWNADFFEWIGMKEVEAKHKRIIRNRNMASGVLDTNDYLMSSNDGLNAIIANEESPLKKFYPLIPPFINVLHGEFIKRDLRVFVTCTDRETQDEKLEYKMEMVNQIIVQDALRKKQQALAQMGIEQVPEEQIAEMDPQSQEQALQINEQFAQEMQTTMQLAQSEQKYKKFRHIMEEFGQLVLDKDRERFKLDEMELDAFIETICNSETAWHIDMLENDYRVEIVDNAMSFSHQSPNVKYYSQGDYFGWFDFMSVGDIINKFGSRLREEHFETLQNSVKDLADNQWAGVGIIPDQFENYQGAFYDHSKPYPKGRTDLNKYQYMKNEVIKDFLTNTSLSSDEMAFAYKNARSFGNSAPKMYRVMRCYFRSQRKIGWLTKKDRSGMITFQGWIDENFKVTETPIYDNYLTKEKSDETLVYGEHVDWTWTNEWRHIIKININNDHPYWREKIASTFDPIYIDGDPIRYNFAGSDDPYDIHPPFEGIQYKMKGVRPVSFVELIAPYQILFNIANNKVPDIMASDIGLAVAINENAAPNNLPGIESGGDPLELMMENLLVNKVLPFKVDRELIKQQGNAAPIVPTVLPLSRIQEGLQYKQLGQMIKEEAGEVIGISRQRLAQAKASESATQTQAGINYSETQTEHLFSRFSTDFMPRIYQKMIEAAMYYATTSGEARAFYQTDTEGNAMLDIEQLQGTLRQYHVTCKSNAKDKALKEKLEHLFLNNNTTDTHMYDLAQGLAESNPASIMENLRQAKVKKEQEAEQQAQQMQQVQQQADEAARQRQAELLAHEEQIQRLKNESNENVAMIRALGGLQTDANADGELDAFENLKMQLEQRRFDLQNKMAQDGLDLQKKKHEDDLNHKNRQLMSKEVIEQKKLAVALANQNAKDDKALNRKIAKKQGVS